MIVFNFGFRLGQRLWSVRGTPEPTAHGKGRLHCPVGVVGRGSEVRVCLRSPCAANKASLALLLGSTNETRDLRADDE